MAPEARFEVPGFDRFGGHPDPRLDRRVPRLWGLLLSIAFLGLFAVTVLLALFLRVAAG